MTLCMDTNMYNIVCEAYTDNMTMIAFNILNEKIYS